MCNYTLTLTFRNDSVTIATIQIISVTSEGVTSWSGAVSSNSANAYGTSSTAIAEGSPAGTTLFSVTASGGGSWVSYTYTYQFASFGNPDSIASSTVTSGTVTLAGTLDYENTNQYIFKVV